MTLYELTGDLLRFQAMMELGPDDDFYDPDFVETQLAATAEEIVGRADDYAKIIRNLSAQAESLKAEKCRLAKKQKTVENSIDRMKGVLLNAMEAMGSDKISTTIGKWSIQNNPPSVQVSDWHLLPERFLKPQDPEIDRRGILDEYKQTGEIFDGCEIVQTRGLRFR